MRATWSLPGFALAALVALAGCGGVAQDATSKELSALTAEISKLRAQQAAQDERLSALERGKLPQAPAAAATPAKPDDPVAPPPAKAATSDRPALDVVRLGPSIDDAIAEEGDGDIDAESPRTVLRSGANGSIVAEQSSGGATRTSAADAAAKKTAPAKDRPKKADKTRTAALPTP